MKQTYWLTYSYYSIVSECHRWNAISFYSSETELELNNYTEEYGAEVKRIGFVLHHNFTSQFFMIENVFVRDFELLIRWLVGFRYGKHFVKIVRSLATVFLEMTLCLCIYFHLLSFIYSQTLIILSLFNIETLNFTMYILTNLTSPLKTLCH